MKVTSITAFVFFLGITVWAAEKKTGVEEDGYNGRVKSVKVSNFKIKEEVRQTYENGR